MHSKRIQAAKIKEFISELPHSHGIYHYPIDTPHSIFEALGQDKLLIFAYGSLLNSDSAYKTLTVNAIESFKPAVAFGLRRVFDRCLRVIPPHWGEAEHPASKACLNAHPTGNANDCVNGILIEVDRHDLQALLEREVGYDLYPVPVILWDQVRSDGWTVHVAFTFRAPKEERAGTRYTSVDIYPIWNYAQASMEGAKRYGDDFLAFWINTTYLSDHQTPFARWFQGFLDS